MFRYFHQMRDAIERHGGTVEKFVGDAVLAVFGVPVAHEDDAAPRGARGARDARADGGAERRDRESASASTLALRIGLNTGEVVAGRRSTRETFVTGDAVNTAARLEQHAAPGEILIGELTAELVRRRGRGGRADRGKGKGRAGAGVPAARARRARRGPSGRSSAARRSSAQLRALFGRVATGQSGGARERRRRAGRRQDPSGGRVVSAAGTRVHRRPLPRLRRGDHLLAARGDRPRRGRDPRRGLAAEARAKIARADWEPRSPRVLVALTGLRRHGRRAGDPVAFSRAAAARAPARARRRGRPLGRAGAARAPRRARAPVDAAPCSCWRPARPEQEWRGVRLEPLGPRRTTRALLDARRDAAARPHRCAPPAGTRSSPRSSPPTSASSRTHGVRRRRFALLGGPPGPARENERGAAERGSVEGELLPPRGVRRSLGGVTTSAPPSTASPPAN